jgi:hypothetical protein
MHVVLAYLFSLTFVPDALIYMEGYVPWEDITIFLNTLGRSGVVDDCFEGKDFPQNSSGTGRQLPEDFVMRGLMWAKHYYPPKFFESELVEEDERSLELPSHVPPRAERCLWLGVQLASVSRSYRVSRGDWRLMLPKLNRWLRYDKQNKQFSITNFGKSGCRSPTPTADRDLDTEMVDVED